MPGARLHLPTDRYELQECVGRGASAEVWRSLDRATGATVALKILRREVPMHAAVTQLSREAELLARIDSPYVVRLLAQLDTAEGAPCLVLEWAPGQDLAAQQREAPLDRDAAVRFGRFAARALAAVHRAGLVHRDVKPSNFIVDTAEQETLGVRLIDLGVALQEGADDATWRGLRVGTPAYMSPEQARGHRGLDARSDLFSLGVILYELLSGVRPFGTGDPFAVLARILFEPPRPLQDLVPTLPHALCAAVSRAMEAQPEQRFSSADELAEELDALAPAPSQATATWLAVTAPPTRSALSDQEQRVLTALLAEGLPEAPGAVEALAESLTSQGALVHVIAGGRLAALWGMGTRHGDEAPRAGRAALNLWASGHSRRIALATGHARADGMPQGQLFDRAAEVLRAARGPLAVDDNTAALLEGHFPVWRGEGPALLLTDAGASALTVGGMRTPTVGRERELDWLSGLAQRCFTRGRARAALVLAPAGAGKSRLASALLDRLAQATPQPVVLVGRSLSVAAVGVLGPLGEALRSFLGLGLMGDLARERDALEAHLCQVPALAADPASREALRALAGLGEPQDADATARDPKLLAEVLLEAWLLWLEHLCAQGPVALVLEDLHWADSATVRFVDRALETCAQRPLFVLALARPEGTTATQSPWPEREVEELRLGPLPRRAAETLARAVLGARAEDSEVSALVERAAGNAFFLEELLRARLKGDASAPPSVVGLVQARTDGLSPMTRRALRAASVYGRRFRRAGVAALLDATEADGLDRALESLCDAELLVRRSGHQEEFEFAHDLLREALYDTLSPQDQSRAHRAAGRWLHGAGERDQALLAHHFELGGELPQAARFFRRAVEQALAADALGLAAEYASSGLRCVSEGEAAGVLYRMRADARAWAGDLESSREDSERALGLLPHASSEWLRALGRRLADCALTGTRSDFEALLERLPEVPREDSAQDAWRLVVYRLIEYLLQFGDVERAEQWLATPGVRPRPGAHWSTTARAAMTEGLLAHAHAEVDAYLAAMGDAMAQFEWHDDRRDASRCRSELGWALALDGRAQDAERQLRATLTQAERLRLPVVRGWTLHRLGRVLTWRGAWEEAHECQRRVLAEGPRAGRWLPLRARLAVAEERLRVGDLLSAAQDLEGLVPEGPQVLLALARCLRGELALASGAPGEALGHFEGASSLSQALRRDPDLGLRLPLGLARAKRALGDLRGAREALLPATSYVQSLLARWPEAEHEARLQAVPERARVLELRAALGDDATDPPERRSPRP